MSGTGAAIGVVVGGVLGAALGGALGNLSPAANTDAMPGLAYGGLGLVLGAIFGAYVGAERGNAPASNPLPASEASRYLPIRRRSGTARRSSTRRR